MPTLLRIDTSARISDSHSRELADAIQAEWQAAHPAGHVNQRDLVSNSIGHIQNETIAGYYTPEEQMTEQLRHATAQSDELIAELQQADAILLSTPMYNFSMPSALKAWIDQVVRVNKTFAVEPDGNMVGIVDSKPVYIAVAAGAQFTGTALESLDFLRPYLQTVLGFIGLTDIHFYSVESTAMDLEMFGRNREQVLEQIGEMFTAEVA